MVATECVRSVSNRFSFREGVVLEIVLLRGKVDMMEKTFSSSFVRDCSFRRGRVRKNDLLLLTTDSRFLSYCTPGFAKIALLD